MKVVINSCFGGFGLSHTGIMRYAELKNIKLYSSSDGGSFKSYYTVPEEEFLRLSEQDKKNGNYKLSNAVYFSDHDIERTDAFLIQVVEELGKKANGCCASLRIVEIPDGIEWEIDEYDGSERIDEQHRSWG